MSYGLVVFAYDCLSNFFGIKNNISEPTPQRMRMVFVITISILFVIMSIIGIAAYYSLELISLQTDLFIFRQGIFNQSDTAMRFAQFSYVFILVLSIVLMNNPTKEMLMHNINFKMSNFWHNLSMSLFLTFFESWLASQLYNAAIFINFIGGMTATVYMFLFPGLMAVKLNVYKTKWSRVLLIV